MKQESTLLQNNLANSLRTVARVFYVALALSFVFTRPAVAQLELLKDVNVSEGPYFNEYSSLTDAGPYMYFLSNNQELWKSNGTTQYTVRLKSLDSISNLMMSGNTLFFTADDGTSGPELWKSNGSSGTTVRVKDIVPGAEGSSPSFLTDVNGILFFAAYSEGNGIELWKSDGTNSGTVMVKDISRGSANPTGLVNSSGTLFFSATSPAGYELWKSDGTSANTVLVRDINTGIKSSNPGNLTVSNDKVFFVALHPATGRELWITDGTAAGTQLVKDIRPGAQTSDAENLIHANGKLMFTAHDGVHGDELWSSDGTAAGTILVKDMNPGSAGSNTTDPYRSFAGMDHFTNINGVLYFVASKGNQDFLYRSDGTGAGTKIISETRNNPGYGPNPQFTYRNGYVYFFNSTRDFGGQTDLYRMPYKGTQISRIQSFEVGRLEQIDREALLRRNMISFNGAVYFFAEFAIGSRSVELIKSDGTTQGTVPVYDTFFPTGDSNPNRMIKINGIVYMLHYFSNSDEARLLRTDGTPEGTFELRPMRYHHEWQVVGNDLYFLESIFDGTTYRWQLFKTQGTPETTVLINSGDAGEEGNAYVPSMLTAVGGMLYYTFSSRIWKTNGTSQGTIVADGMPVIRSIADVNGTAFIIAENEMDNLEVWKETSSGLTLIKSFPEGRAVWFGRDDPTAVIGDILYFLANDGIHDLQIWSSDGTTAGTVMMFGPDGFEQADWTENRTPRFIPFNDTLYFNAVDGNGNWGMYYASGNNYVRFNDLGVVDSQFEANDKLFFSTMVDYEPVRKVYAMGQNRATTLLTTFNGFFPIGYAQVGDHVYFNISETSELWRSDGTSCGTTPVDVGATDPFPLEGLGQDLIFGGHVVATGREPYVYHNVNSIAGPDCEEATMYVSEPVSENILTPYPNPFTDGFTLKVPGNEGELAQVAVYTGTGMPVEMIENIPVNTERSNIGAAWKQGFYIVQVKKGANLETYHVIKK